MLGWGLASPPSPSLLIHGSDGGHNGFNRIEVKKKKRKKMVGVSGTTTTVLEASRELETKRSDRGPDPRTETRRDEFPLLRPEKDQCASAVSRPGRCGVFSLPELLSHISSAVARPELGVRVQFSSHQFLGPDLDSAFKI